MNERNGVEYLDWLSMVSRDPQRGDVVDFQDYKLKVSGRQGDNVNYVYNNGATKCSHSVPISVWFHIAIGTKNSIR